MRMFSGRTSGPSAKVRTGNRVLQRQTSQQFPDLFILPLGYRWTQVRSVKQSAFALQSYADRSLSQLLAFLYPSYQLYFSALY